MMILTVDTLLQQRYRIRRVIAQGGMGVVYQATDQRLLHDVAIKQTRFCDEQLLAAFFHEAMLLATLRHPSLPRVTDHFTEVDSQFLVMDYIPGDDLGAQLQQHGAPFLLDNVLQWADQLLAVLDYLHNHNPMVLHRDIKPQNIKILPNGQLILLDFGTAKGHPAYHTQKFSTYTPGYAPLEQIQAVGTTPRSDIYGVGATLYHLLANTPPVDALTRAAMHINGQPDPLMPLPSTIPSAVATVIMQALAMQESIRPASAAAMQHALHQFHYGQHDTQHRMNSSGQPTIILSQPEPISAPPQPLITVLLQGITKRCLDVVTDIAFSPDGASIAVAVLGKVIYIYDVASGKEQAQLKGHTGWWVFGSVNALAWHPNGQLLASGGADKTVRLWDVHTARQIETIRMNTGEVKAVAWNNDGQLLAAGGWDNHVCIWDMHTHTHIATCAVKSTVYAVAWHPTLQHIAIGSSDNTIHVWDVTQQTMIATLTGHTKTVTSVAYAPDGLLLASGSNDKSVRLWQTTTNKTHAVLQHHKKHVQTIAFRNDGHLLASGGNDKQVVLWRIADGTPLEIIQTEDSETKRVIFSPDGHMLAIGNYHIQLVGLSLPEPVWQRIRKAWHN